MKEVTPYQLATLASRIDPERCISDPKQAITAAQTLLKEANEEIVRVFEEECSNSMAEDYARLPRENYVSAVKKITGQKRRDRAEECFLEFFKYSCPEKWEEYLNRYKRDGLNEDDIREFQIDFTDWLKQTRRKRGKQGRRVSRYDGRLRIPLGRLLPTKPRKPI